MPLELETATILTLSISHLHPDTISLIDSQRGDIAEGPSIAVRQEGFLMNTHIGEPHALKQDTLAGLHPSLLDRHPDLTLIRAVARGLGAEWVNFDQDGVVYKNVLPVYEEGQEVVLPEDPIWDGALVQRRKTASGTSIVVPSIETLENMQRINGRYDYADAEPSMTEGPD